MMKKLFTVLFAALVMAMPICAMAFGEEETSVSTPNISVTTATGSATFTLKSDSKDAKIYYTTDGSDPTTSDKKYSKSVKVTKSCEVRAVAYESGEYSPVGYYTVTVTKARAATPTVKATDVAGGKKLTMTSSGATIYYTTDGSTPTTSDSKYSSKGVLITESCYVKAMAVRSGYQNSPVTTVYVKVPQFSGKPTLKASSSGSSTVVKITSSSSYTYYYTLDGSTPVPEATSYCKKYTSSGIKVKEACVIKVIVCRNGYAPSPVYAFEYKGPQCATPTHSDSGTAVIGGVKITLKCATSGATIYYTINGGTPTEYDEKYTSSGIIIEEPGTSTVRYIAMKSGYGNSDVGSVRVSLTQLAKPKASTSDPETATSRKIKLTGATGSSIYYTTDGSEPTTSSKKVSSGGTVTIKEDCVLTIMAAKKGYANSEPVSYNIETGNGSSTTGKRVSNPTASQTKYEDYTKVTLRCSTSGATIFYTLDGSNPLLYGEEYKSAIKVERSCLLYAIAVKDGYENSQVLQYPVSVKGDDVVVLGTGGSEPTYTEAPSEWGSAYGKYSDLLDEFDAAAAEDGGYPDIDDDVILPMDGNGNGSYSEEDEFDLDISWEEGVKNTEETKEPVGDEYISL